MTAQGVRDDMTKSVQHIYLESNPHHEILDWSKVENFFLESTLIWGRIETDSK